MKQKILYLTDLNYRAKGRDYCKEDIFISDRLKEHFDIVLCHPQCAESFEDFADLIVFRNTGSIIGYKEVYRSFVKRVNEKGLKTFNTFNGKADMRGKQYLLDLTINNYPVIRTVDALSKINLLPKTDKYVIKPKDGADSIGLEFLTRDELFARKPEDGEFLIQPEIDFDYEVSFYFINDKFEYSLFAPDKSKRWELKEYPYTAADIAFAKSFIDWNSIKTGIQRVDACRTKDGQLLLVELEDLNPFLSLLEVNETTRDQFMCDFVEAINSVLR